MSDRESLKPARVFVALWPDPTVRKHLAEAGRRLQAKLAGKPSRPETIHLTLVFIGDLARDRLPELIGALQTVSASDFEIDFDRAACWPHNRIGYLSPRQPPDELFGLVSSVESVLEGVGIPFDHRPYKPHITLIRKADCPKRNPALGRGSISPEWGDFAPIRWSANNFVLLESVLSAEGPAYRQLQRYALS